MDVRRAGEAVRILLADDRGSLDGTLTEVLTEDQNVSVVGHALERREAIDLARTLRPEIVLLDVTGPGARATRELRALAPETRVVALTDSQATSAIGEVAEAGVVGYLRTDELSPDVLRLVVQLAAHMNRAGP